MFTCQALGNSRYSFVCSSTGHALYQSKRKLFQFVYDRNVPACIPVITILPIKLSKKENGTARTGLNKSVAPQIFITSSDLPLDSSSLLFKGIKYSYAEKKKKFSFHLDTSTKYIFVSHRGRHCVLLLVFIVVGVVIVIGGGGLLSSWCRFIICRHCCRCRCYRCCCATYFPYVMSPCRM